jgi:hypothetical protein
LAKSEELVRGEVYIAVMNIPASSQLVQVDGFDLPGMGDVQVTVEVERTEGRGR